MAKSKRNELELLIGFKLFTSTILPNIGRVFTGWNLLAHAALIALTAGIVLSGLDWWWFVHSRWVPDWVYWPAAVIGALTAYSSASWLAARGCNSPQQTGVEAGIYARSSSDTR